MAILLNGSVEASIGWKKSKLDILRTGLKKGLGSHLLLIQLLGGLQPKDMDAPSD